MYIYIHIYIYTLLLRCEIAGMRSLMPGQATEPEMFCHLKYFPHAVAGHFNWTSVHTLDGPAKSCITLNGWNPTNHGINHRFQLAIRISQPSTVCLLWFSGKLIWRHPTSPTWCICSEDPASAQGRYHPIFTRNPWKNVAVYFQQWNNYISWYITVDIP